ncbi:uncharacterized protein LOC122266454 [Penaeus japonicus]|uniref:uncharacterized protein LOC122266454 n=1 Tax=Penaeus japonicus TaxID=27405 RepID=UPI001C70C9FE|nr:uncharacterized protein LOC122266454 [Penaeus japonicus]XP_042892155.1 uncharacterized protein LOC122266454 [Penaeus japonicus]
MCSQVILVSVMILGVAAGYIVFSNFTLAAELKQLRNESDLCKTRTEESIKTCQEETQLAEILLRDLTEAIDKMQDDGETLRRELDSLAVEKQMGEQLATTVVELTIQENALEQELVSMKDKLQDTLSRVMPLKEANNNLRETIAQTVII